MDFTWNRTTTKHLIKLFREKRCLWDTMLPAYQDKELREKYFIEIQKDLSSIIPNISVKAIKIKIHSVRSQYCKQLRQMSKGGKNSLWCFDLLSFLPKSNKSLNLREEWPDDNSAERADVSNDGDTSNKCDAEGQLPNPTVSIELNNANAEEKDLSMSTGDPKMVVPQKVRLTSRVVQDYKNATKEEKDKLRKEQMDMLNNLMYANLKVLPEPYFYKAKWKIIEALREIEIEAIMDAKRTTTNYLTHAIN